MLHRYGPRLWDWLGPGIGEKFWSRPKCKHDSGELLYSAIQDAASSTAYMAAIQAVCATPIFIAMTWSVLANNEAWRTPQAAIMTTLWLAFCVMTYFTLYRLIAFTQLPATMAADGAADDMYGDDEEDDEEDPEDDEEEYDEDDGEQAGDVVEFRRPEVEDDWSDAS